jgi:hypothetical protein
MEVQGINQVKLGGYSSNKVRLYTGDRGKSIIGKEAGTGISMCWVGDGSVRSSVGASVQEGMYMSHQKEEKR